jgi:hypothetical protein
MEWMGFANDIIQGRRGQIPKYSVFFRELQLPLLTKTIQLDFEFNFKTNPPMLC